MPCKHGHPMHAPCTYVCPAQPSRGAQAKDGEVAEAAAVRLAAGLKQGGVLRAFDGGRQVPKRSYTLEDLRLNKIEPQRLLSPTDNTLTGVRTALQVHPKLSNVP